MNRVGAITHLIGLPYSLTVVRIVLRRIVSICVCMFLKKYTHLCVCVCTLRMSYARNRNTLP